MLFIITISVIYHHNFIILQIGRVHIFRVLYLCSHIQGPISMFSVLKLKSNAQP